MPLVPELALAALAVLVLFVGLVRRGDPEHWLGWVTFVGVLAALGLTLLTTILFGLVPAIHATRLNVQAALAECGMMPPSTLELER